MTRLTWRWVGSLFSVAFPRLARWSRLAKPSSHNLAPDARSLRYAEAPAKTGLQTTCWRPARSLYNLFYETALGIKRLIMRQKLALSYARKVKFKVAQRWLARSYATF
jgi:hypothetical protein